METRHSGHAVYRTEYHVIWIPKYRRRILNPGIKGYLAKVLPIVVGSIPGCEILKLNIKVDHIHMIIMIPPKFAVSDVIGRIKGKTSSLIRKKFAWLKNVYWKENVVWSTGYFVSTIGIEEDKVIKYIDWQEGQDSGQAKLEI